MIGTVTAWSEVLGNVDVLKVRMEKVSRTDFFPREGKPKGPNDTESFRVLFFLSFFFFIFVCIVLHLPLAGNSGRLTWIRLQQPQEQRYPFLTVCAVFS